MSLLDRTLLIVGLLKDTVVAISDSYAVMPAIIDEEHDALKQSDLDVIETLAARKLELGSRLDGLFRALKQHCSNLSDIAVSANVPVGRSEEGSLSANFSIIEALIQTFDAANLNTSAVKQIFEGLKDALENFYAVKESAQQKVEVNKVVLNKLLLNRQENYRFWQEVAADMMAAYDKGGKQKANRSSSILNVKA